jgi:hypothetical protein
MDKPILSLPPGKLIYWKTVDDEEILQEAPLPHEEVKKMQDTPTSSSTRFANIHTLANRFEADVLLDALKKEGISAFVRSFEETAYDGLFVCQRGWGWIMVPEELSSRAIEIIKPLVENIQSRTIYVDPSEVDPSLWDRLREADPGVICRNAEVAYDPGGAAYVVPFLNSEFLCSAERQCVEPLRRGFFGAPDFQFYLVLLHYLLEAKPVSISGKWVSEKEIPGGELFFRGPHGLPIEPLTKIFGRRTDLFRAVADKTGGTPVAMGDLAFQFVTFPRIPLVLVLWEGDEEFDPEMRLRFDSTVTSQLERLDAIWALANVFSKSLRACAESLS